MKLSAIFFVFFLVACSKNNTDNAQNQNNTPPETTVKEEVVTPPENALNNVSRPSPPDKVMAEIGGKQISIIYSQPAVRGREVWGKLVPYDEVWRTGANEASVIEFSKNVKIEGKDLPAGKYAFFSIPNSNEWTLIFNKTYEQWGAFKYDPAEDALRVKVKPQSDQMQERLKFAVQNNEVSLRWEKIKVVFKVE